MVKPATKKKAAKKKVTSKKPAAKKSVKKKTASAKSKARKSKGKKKKITPEEQFKKNIVYLVKRAPGLARHLEKTRPFSKLVWLENGEPDVEFRNIYLYKEEGAYTETRRHLDEFYEKPYRISAGTSGGMGLDQHSGPFFQNIVKRASKEEVRIAPSFSSDKCYFLFILGVGLGAHIAELIRKYDPNNICIIEPNDEFFFHSLSTADWEGIYEEADKRGASIQFSTASSPSELSQAISSHIRTACPPGMDGTVIYRHYGSSLFDNALSEMESGVLKSTMMGLGFFEDDMTMISHSYANLYPGKARIMRWLDSEINIQAPVFIIGNGPSLDDQIEFIRGNQERAIIISCGTALDPLLHENVHPDFQIQIERDVGEYAVYQITERNFDISNINLIASSTIYPEIAPMFKESIFFFRPGLSSMPLFKRADDQVLPMPDPSVVNTALSFALHAGFRKFYLFGCDMGAKSREYHHAKKSVYSEDDSVLPAYLAGEQKEKLKETFNHELKGNFGGTVLTSDTLLWTKKMLEGLISHKGMGRRIWNCSDGAFIEGTSPKYVESIFLEDIEGGKQKIVDKLMEAFPGYTAEMFDAAWEEGAMWKTVPELTDSIKKSFKGKRSLKDRNYLTELMGLFKPGEASDAPAMLYRGSMMLLFAGINWYLNRVYAEDDRKKMEKIVRDEVIKFADELCEEAVGDFEGLVEKYEGTRD